MTWDSILPLVRHVLQFVSGYFVAKGVIDGAMAEQAVGGVLSIASVIWWFVTKPKAA